MVTIQNILTSLQWKGGANQTALIDPRPYGGIGCGMIYHHFTRLGW
jgi:hypothetical protein